VQKAPVSAIERGVNARPNYGYIDGIISRDLHAWVLGYIRGRIRAFQRGRITRTNLDGAVQMALRKRVSWQRLRAVFDEYACDWKIERRTKSRTH
jgi:hypothetical protein